MYVNLAARMARDTEVAYYSSWLNAFPQSQEMAPGSGIKNVTRVNDPIQFMLDNNASCVIVADQYLESYQELADAMELPALGPGRGTKLEQDRWLLKEYLEQHKLPVGPAVLIEGIDALEGYLRENDDKYIKVSTFRGDLETYHHETWDKTRPEFYRWALKFGALGKRIQFIVEDPIPDAKELGVDTYFRKGRFVLPCYYGQEIKDAGYVGYRIDQFDKGTKPIMDALAKYFAQSGYDWFFSNEMRIKDGDYYMTDATCRIPSPPGGAMMAAMKNFTAFMLKNEEPEKLPEYICEIILKSDVPSKGWMGVDIPKGMKDRVMMHNYCEVDGKTWAIPHDAKYVEFGSACGWGSLEDACQMALETAQAIKADGLYFDDHVLEKAQEALGE